MAGACPPQNINLDLYLGFTFVPTCVESGRRRSNHVPSTGVPFLVGGRSCSLSRLLDLSVGRIPRRGDGIEPIGDCPAALGGRRAAGCRAYPGPEMMGGLTVFALAGPLIGRRCPSGRLPWTALPIRL